MHNVFKGIVVGVLGFIIWFLVSIVYGVGLGLGAPENPTLYALMVIGFVLMLGGPIVYIMILPIVNRLKRQTQKSRA